jgi:hypothetical protein
MESNSVGLPMVPPDMRCRSDDHVGCCETRAQQAQVKIVGIGATSCAEFLKQAQVTQTSNATISLGTGIYKCGFAHTSAG